MFQACVAVNVETGEMFLIITQNGEFVPALVALRCADKRLFARALWTRTVVSFLCRSQRCHDISRMAQVKKSSALCHTHFLSHTAKKNDSRGAKYGRFQEQYDHFKANESTRHSKKKGYDSITLRFQNDELYRNSQLAIGWTEEHCQHLDSLMTIDFSDTATRKEHQRREIIILLASNGQGPKPGPMNKRADHQQAVNKLLVMRRQVGNPNPYIPTHLRFRQRPTEERERLEQHWRRWGWISWSESSSSSSTTWWLASTEKPAWWSSEDWQE